MDNGSSLRSKGNAPITPKSKPRRSDGFSPAAVLESPITRSPQSGNLTGNPRRVRDSAAELFNLIQDWNSNQLNGVAVLSDITSLKFSVLPEVAGSVCTGSDYPPGIDVLVENLNEICSKMDEIVLRMKEICKELKSLSTLEYLRNPNPTPMFLTWPPEKFEETSEKIFKSYSKELKLKYYIKENIAHCFTKSNIVLHSAAWLYQPYIDDSVNVILEAMLKETGHR